MMHILVLFVAGFLLTCTMFVIMHRVNLKRFLGYSTAVDLAFTVIMFMMFAHTFSGVVAGSFAGLLMAAGLTTLRNAIGYQRLRWKRWRFVWADYPPKWNIPSINSIMEKHYVAH